MTYALTPREQSALEDIALQIYNGRDRPRAELCYKVLPAEDPDGRPWNWCTSCQAEVRLPLGIRDRMPVRCGGCGREYVVRMFKDFKDIGEYIMVGACYLDRCWPTTREMHLAEGHLPHSALRLIDMEPMTREVCVGKRTLSRRERRRRARQWSKPGRRRARHVGTTVPVYERVRYAPTEICEPVPSVTTSLLRPFDEGLNVYEPVSRYRVLRRHQFGAGVGCRCVGPEGIPWAELLVHVYAEQSPLPQEVNTLVDARLQLFLHHLRRMHDTAPRHAHRRY